MNFRAFKELILPPAGPLLVAAAGGALLFTPWAGLGRMVVTAGLVAAYGLATPALGIFLLRRLESRHPPLDPATLPEEVGAIVILDAGGTRGAREWARDGGAAPNAQTPERLRYGAYLHRENGLPLLVSGDGAGALMALALERDFGVAVRFVEPHSRHTQENADHSAGLLGPAGISGIVLVTHAWHLPRAFAAFRRRGFEVVPAPLGFTARQRGERALFALLPSPSGVSASYWACHELLGLAFYRLRYLLRAAKVERQ